MLMMILNTYKPRGSSIPTKSVVWAARISNLEIFSVDHWSHLNIKSCCFHERIVARPTITDITHSFTPVTIWKLVLGQ